MRARSTCLIALSALVALTALSCGDSSPSEPSKPSCSYGIASTNTSFLSAGGQGSATLTTAAGCSWTVSSDSTWVTFPSGSTGSGPATIGFAVASNAAADIRKATLSVAGQSLGITQDGRTACQFAVAPSSVDLGATGGPTSISIATSPGCEWNASSSVNWITIGPAASGSGSGSVSLTVAPNAETGERQATITAAGSNVLVRQAGSGSPPHPTQCQYAVSPTDTVVHWHATTLTVNIATSAGCSWTVSPSESWLSLDRSSGSGSGSIAVTFPTFTEDATRRAAVQVRWPTPTAGQNSWLSQEGCRYGFEGEASFPASGGSRRLTVVMQQLSPSCSIGCPWTATSNVAWIRVTSPMPMAGDDMFSYVVDANTGPARVGTITIAGRFHTVNQSGS